MLKVLVNSYGHIGTVRQGCYKVVHWLRSHTHLLCVFSFQNMHFTVLEDM